MASLLFYKHDYNNHTAEGGTMKTFTEIIETIGAIILLLAWIPTIVIFLFVDWFLGGQHD